MEYGIQPVGIINEAFVSKFNDLEVAKNAAEKLSEKHHVEVMVFQFFGSFKPTTKWVSLNVDTTT